MSRYFVVNTDFPVTCRKLQHPRHRPVFAHALTGFAREYPRSPKPAGISAEAASMVLPPPPAGMQIHKRHIKDNQYNGLKLCRLRRRQIRIPGGARIAHARAKTFWPHGQRQDHARVDHRSTSSAYAELHLRIVFRLLRLEATSGLPSVKIAWA